MSDTYELRVNVEINRVDPNGGWTGERLAVNETYRLPAAGFGEITGVLAQFHALAEKVKGANE